MEWVLACVQILIDYGRIDAAKGHSKRATMEYSQQQEFMNDKISEIRLLEFSLHDAQMYHSLYIIYSRKEVHILF